METKELPPQLIDNFSFLDMLLKQNRYIIWSNIPIPVGKKWMAPLSIIEMIDFGQEEKAKLPNVQSKEKMKALVQ